MMWQRHCTQKGGLAPIWAISSLSCAIETQRSPLPPPPPPPPKVVTVAVAPPSASYQCLSLAASVRSGLTSMLVEPTVPMFLP